MRKIKPINYKKILHKLTLRAGSIGAIFTFMLFMFHLYATRAGIWSSAAERINYDNISIAVSGISLFLFAVSMILDDEAER